MLSNSLFLHCNFNYMHMGGWMHNLFVYLFIYWSNRMAGLLLCCYFTTLCTSKGDISASAVYYLWRLFVYHYYIGRPSLALFGTSVAFSVAFIFLCSLCCNMLSANDSTVVDYGHKHTLLRSSIFL